MCLFDLIYLIYLIYVSNLIYLIYLIYISSLSIHLIYLIYLHPPASTSTLHPPPWAGWGVGWEPWAGFDLGLSGGTMGITHIYIYIYAYHIYHICTHVPYTSMVIYI